MQSWLFSRKLDIGGLFIPVWVTWIACFFVPTDMMTSELPLWAWVIFILGADVSHVWSTIFRTYLDKSEFQNHKKVLLIAPILCLIILLPFALFEEMVFWRVMAYFALYHFIKQQYGFLMLYQAKSKSYLPKRISDRFIIYFSMLYPVIIWHFSEGLRFDWFVKGDFFELHSFIDNQLFISEILPLGNTIYWGIIGIWLLEEIWVSHQANQFISWGKILWTLTTAGNWFLGIIWFNSDFAFSVTNVIAHGIPYMILVFFYVERKKQIYGNISRPLASFQVIINVSVMILIVMLLAFGEEFFWDMLLNREKQAIFEPLLSYPFAMLESPTARAFAIVILSIPQVSHYIIDGFIWKNTKQNPYLKPILFG